MPGAGAGAGAGSQRPARTGGSVCLLGEMRNRPPGLPGTIPGYPSLGAVMYGCITNDPETQQLRTATSTDGLTQVWGSGSSGATGLAGSALASLASLQSWTAPWGLEALPARWQV